MHESLNVTLLKTQKGTHWISMVKSTTYDINRVRQVPKEYYTKKKSQRVVKQFKELWFLDHWQFPFVPYSIMVSL